LSKSTLWTVFADTVSRFGERTAVEIQRSDTVDRFTYRQLGDMASARASQLAALGIGRGDRCAILAPNDAHWCAAYLGILKLGAVAVPLDTNYSSAQVTTIVRDAGAKVMFVSDQLRPTAIDAGVQLVALHEEPTLEPFEPLEPVEPLEPLEPVEPTSSAVILYTSGTTADPKGVVLSHANLIAERDAAFSVVHVSERDAVLGVLPLFHSLAQLANLLLPFAAGARVVYLETVNSSELLRALKERRITIFACVPQFFYLIHQRVMRQVRQSALPVRALFRLLLGFNFRLRRVGLNLGRVLFGKVHDVMGRDMRLLVTGGSKFDPAVGRDLYAMGFSIQQAYGLTETSAAATICSPHDAYIDTVGRPFPGVEVRIEDDGEIAIRGPIVMAGYHNRPEATAEVLKNGWLMTGDLGRIDDAGRLTITGRKKEMIVLASGKNIYPEEIEAHYRRSPFVKEICVMGLAEPGRPTSERLFAVVVPNLELLRERRIVNAGDILRFELEGLAVWLPAHKRVLGYEIWFEPLPRTTTQKVKRHEVERRVREKQRDAARPAAQASSETDRRWLEEPHVSAAAAAIAARMKNDLPLRPDANLELDLGLDSMERVELLTELEQRFGVKVSPASAATIFTVSELVEAVRPGTAASAGAAAPDESWATILRDLAGADAAELRWLLRRRTFAAPLHFTLLRAVRFLFFRVRVSGLEHLPEKGPYIISPNHQSYVDPFVLCGVLPYRIFKDIFFVGAVEYFETPFTRWVAHTANIVPVDPDSNLIPAMKAGAFGLSHGKILMLFPEGERSIDGTVKKFKKGSPILARHLGVPIVPVAIKGVYELWPRNRGINWRLVAPWSGHRPAIEVGVPLSVAPGVSHADSAVELHERVNEMWQRI
jgi:long-chain acyl-CoA synthetase